MMDIFYTVVLTIKNDSRNRRTKFVFCSIRSALDFVRLAAMSAGFVKAEIIES